MEWTAAGHPPRVLTDEKASVGAKAGCRQVAVCRGEITRRYRGLNDGGSPTARPDGRGGVGAKAGCGSAVGQSGQGPQVCLGGIEGPKPSWRVSSAKRAGALSLSTGPLSIMPPKREEFSWAGRSRHHEFTLMLAKSLAVAESSHIFCLLLCNCRSPGPASCRRKKASPTRQSCCRFSCHIPLACDQNFPD
jgi:hypothetical protein